MTKSKSVTRTKIKVIETEKILTNLRYKGHRLQVCFDPGMNAFRVWLIFDDTQNPYNKRLEAFCPYNMSKTAAEHFIRYLYWYQCCIVDQLEYDGYDVEEETDDRNRIW